MRLFDFFRRGTDRDRFAKAVIRRAAERSWPHEITYDRAQFCLRYGPGGATFFLENVYADWLKSDADGKRADIDRLVSTMFEGELPSDLESSLPLLLPTIRNRRALECQWLDSLGKIERAWWDGAFQPLCHSLAIVLVIDRPTSIALIDNRKYREWNASLGQLMERAVTNLRERSPTLFERHPSGFYISQYEDQYDCSRLLVPELFDLLSLNGDPVAIPVARNSLVVAGSNDVGALCAMARFAEEAIGESVRAIAYLPLVLRDKVWSVFEAEGSALEPVRDLVAKQSLWDYESQRNVLQDGYTRQGREVFVGKIIAKKFDGKVYSITTWTETVQTLLPHVDAIAITRVDGQWIMRSWDDFWTVCGDLLSAQHHHPMRYMTPSWMDDARFEHLLNNFGPPAWLPEPANNAKLQ